MSLSCLPLLLPLVAAPDDVHDRAQALLEADDASGAVELLTDHLRRHAADGFAAELYGQALAELERDDEAAHWLDQALLAYTHEGDKRSASRAEKALAKIDSLAKKRGGMIAGLVRDLGRAAERLEDSDQPERALELYLRVLPLATGKALDEARAAVERIQLADLEVDLDAASGGGRAEDGVWPELIVETNHYTLICDLEPEVVDLLAITVEDIFDGFVQIYFDGDLGEAPERRVTIHVHSTWDDMAGNYPGGVPSPGVQGWWSPGQAEIHAYDARTRGGSLDSTLLTLLHEGSHQFMSTFARGGTPAWINEGTACFFEGTTVMVDGRVLWPDAARGRLMALAADLTAKPRRGPRPREVISHPGPGSYPGNYYHHGWGLAYFLQQWEHPETLEYAYRNHYLEMLERYKGGDGQGLAVFEDVMLGPDSPLGHATMDEFIVDWEAWILEEVLPLHQGAVGTRRERRMARARRYLAALDGIAERASLVKLSEEDLLLRALGELEVVRKEIDAETPSRDVLELLATVLEQLGRKKTAAAMIEQLLNAADAGAIELSEDEYAGLERRLKDLDKSNYALRNASARTRTHTQRMLGLIEDYRRKYPDMVLRAYTLTSAAAQALADEGDLAALASELRAQAKADGKLLGRIVAVAGPRGAWKTAFADPPLSFEVARDGVHLESVRPMAMIDTSLAIEGEYEVRAKLVRKGERHLGIAHGIVIAGTMETDWTVIGIDEDGHVGVWSLRNSGAGSARFKFRETLFLDEEVAEGASPELVVRVKPDGSVFATVDGRETVETELDYPLEGATHVGVFVRDGRVQLVDFLVEIFA